MIAKLTERFEALSMFLNLTELMRVRLGGSVPAWALLHYSRVRLATCRDPVNGVVRGNIKLSGATLRCANITNTVPQAYPRSSGTIPDDRHEPFSSHTQMKPDIYVPSLVLW